jgi:hypothetical protein
MTKTKRTISRDSVFRNTSPAPADAPQQGLPAPEPPARQTAVWLADEEVDWLDSRCQEIKRAGWRNVTRSAVIRSLIRAAMKEPADFSGVSGEPDLVQRLVSNR